MVVALTEMGNDHPFQRPIVFQFFFIFLSFFLFPFSESSQLGTNGGDNGGEEIYSNSSSRTASIRSRSGSGRVSTTDLERLSAPTAVAPPAAPPMAPGQSSPRTPRVYASVAEMKRMRVRPLFLFIPPMMILQMFKIAIRRRAKDRRNCSKCTRNFTAPRNCVGNRRTAS